MDSTIRLIARVCHEVNRAYCASLGDTSQPPFNDAPAWQQQSAFDGVAKVLNDPTITPEALHEEWCRVKERDGWKFGPVKNPETLEHPCLVPYSALPPEQQTKDHLFGAVVRAFIAAGVDAGVLLVAKD